MGIWSLERTLCPFKGSFFGGGESKRKLKLSIQQHRLYSVARRWRRGSQTHRSASPSREAWGVDYDGGSVMRGGICVSFLGDKLVSSRN